MHDWIKLLGHIFWSTGAQFISIFGLFIAAGAVLTYLSRLTSNTFRQFMYPRFGIYVFGWIGIPVHEFCHAFFCKLFFHQIRKVKWFDPKGHGGSHGFVEHEYGRWNLYQRSGQFFIGIGPVLLGPVLLAALAYWMVPTTRALFSPDFVTMTPRLPYIAHALVNRETLSSWPFWLFVYLNLAICSQMELSIADLKQALKGSGFVLATLFLLNTLAALAHFDWHSRAKLCGQLILTTGSVFFAFAILLSLINLTICYLVLTFLNRCGGREGINPFEM